MNSVERSAQIGKLIQHLERTRKGELDMADRLIKNNPRLLKGLGENITQADYQNAKALSYHLGYGAAIDKAIKEINKIFSDPKIDYDALAEEQAQQDAYESGRVFF